MAGQLRDNLLGETGKSVRGRVETQRHRALGYYIENSGDARQMVSSQKRGSRPRLEIFVRAFPIRRLQLCRTAKS